MVPLVQSSFGEMGEAEVRLQGSESPRGDARAVRVVDYSPGWLRAQPQSALL